MQAIDRHAPSNRLQASSYIVPPNKRRERVDKVLAQAFPGHSRVAFQRALEAGLVKVDGKVISLSIV